MSENRPRRGLLFPALLITLGVVFLLGNLGLIPPVSVRAIVSLWPLILIVIGIEMLLARQRPALALVLEVVAMALGVALVIGQPVTGLFAGSASSTEVSIPRDGAGSLELKVNGGAGRYVLTGGAAALVEARSDGADLRARTDRFGDRAEVRLEPVHPFDLLRFGPDPVADVRIRIASDVPTSFDLDLGAGDFTIDLRGVAVSSVRLSTGASRVRIVLPLPKGDIPVRVEAGAASVTLEVPEGVEARVTIRGGAVGVSSENLRLPVRGGSAETGGYAAARDRVTVTVDAGATSVTIR